MTIELWGAETISASPFFALNPPRLCRKVPPERGGRIFSPKNRLMPFPEPLRAWFIVN